MDDFTTYIMSTSNAAENGNTLADGKKTDSTDKGKSEHSSANPSSPDNPSVPADKSITAVPESSSAVSPDQPTTEATVTTAAGQKDDLFQHLLTPSADWYTKDITDFQGSVHWDQLVKEVRKQADKLPHYSKEDLQKLAQTVSKDAGQGMGLVMRGLDQIKNGLQSQGDKLEQLLQTASLGPGDNPEPTESSSKSKAEEVIETPSVTGQSANQRSGDAANVFPTLPSAASLASAQQTVRGWWGGFTKQTLPTQVEKSEVTMNRWGIGITNFIQQAFTIEAPEGNPTGTSSSTARSSGNMGSSPGSAQSTLQQRRHDRLTKLQSDKQTYLVDPLVDDKGKAPAQVAEEFAQFASEYSWAAYEPEAQALLADHQSPVYAMHQMLVPMQADNDTFWLRYFFRKYQLEEQERVRERLISGAGAGEVAQSIASRNSMTTSSLTTPIVSPRASLGTRPTSTAHAARDSQQEGTPETSHDVGNKHPVDSLAPGPVPTSDNSTKAKDDEGDVGWGTDDEVGLEDNIKGLSVTSPTTSPSALEIPPSGVTLPSSPSLESVPSPSNASSVPSPSKVTDTTVQGKKGGSPSSTLNTTTPTTQSKTNNAQPPQGSEDDDDWGDWE